MPASAIVRPSVVDFMELSLPGRGGEIILEEIRVLPGAPTVGRTVSTVERETPRLRIVALKRGHESIQVIPDAELEIKAGDLLVVVGDRGSLERL
jgi:voltage-gated potassium channel